MFLAPKRKKEEESVEGKAKKGKAGPKKPVSQTEKALHESANILLEARKYQLSTEVFGCNLLYSCLR